MIETIRNLSLSLSPTLTPAPSSTRVHCGRKKHLDLTSKEARRGEDYSNSRKRDTSIANLPPTLHG